MTMLRSALTWLGLVVGIVALIVQFVISMQAYTAAGRDIPGALGMFFAYAEVKLILHQLLRRFDWAVDPAYQVPLSYYSLPYPKDGQPILLEPRGVHA